MTENMIFTGEDWTGIHIENWKNIVPNPEQIKTFVEIGTWEGKSLVWWANYLTNAEVFSIDPSPHLERRKTLFHNISLHPRANKITMICGSSQQKLPDFGDNSIDLFYIDGSHEAKDVLWDGLTAFRLLKPGGIIIFDDYELQEPLGFKTVKPSVGIDAFLEVIECEVIHKGWQLAIRKPNENNS